MFMMMINLASGVLGSVLGWDVDTEYDSNLMEGASGLSEEEGDMANAESDVNWITKIMDVVTFGYISKYINIFGRYIWGFNEILFNQLLKFDDLSAFKIMMDTLVTFLYGIAVFQLVTGREIF